MQVVNTKFTRLHLD